MEQIGGTGRFVQLKDVVDVFLELWPQLHGSLMVVDGQRSLCWTMKVESIGPCIFFFKADDDDTTIEDKETSYVAHSTFLQTDGGLYVAVPNARGKDGLERHGAFLRCIGVNL